MTAAEFDDELRSATTWARNALPLLRRLSPINASGQPGFPTQRGFCASRISDGEVTRIRAPLHEYDASAHDAAIEVLREAVDLVAATTDLVNAGNRFAARTKAAAALWRVVDGIGLSEESDDTTTEDSDT